MGTIQNENHKTKTGKTITIRSATAADAKSVLALANEVFRTSDYLLTTPEEFQSFTEEMQAQRLQKFADNPAHVNIVAEVDGQIVGMLDFQNGGRQRVAHIGTLGMSLHSQWRNQGIGRLLLSSLIHWVEHHSCVEVIQLAVMEENVAAIKLYKSLGFEITGREPFGVKTAEGRYHPNLTMSLKVR
ncbi:MAG TPA: GNAT family N-acetyltransferase [Bdellovibrio sp.]